MNAKQQLLLVKPTYRENWLLPGGIVEAHESPRAACLREVKEELGLDVSVGHLLCLEYRSTAPPKTESIQFVFYCGVLSSFQIQHIQLPYDELSSFCFVSFEEAGERLEMLSAERTRWALKALHEQRTIYAEDGFALT